MSLPYQPWTPSPNWPEDPENIDGWVDYGVFVGVAFIIPFLLGCFLTLYMWIYCCCIKGCNKCKCKSLNPDNRKPFLIGYTAAYAVFLLLGILGIALTAVTTRNLNNSVESVKTFADAVPESIIQINTDLDVVQGDLFNLVDAVSADLSTYSFDQVNTQLNRIVLLTAGLRGGIQAVNDSLAGITVYYGNLVDDYVYLQDLASQGAIPNAPNNDTLRNPLEENRDNIDDAISKFNEFDVKISEVRQTINDTQEQFIADRDQQVADLKNEVATVMGDVQVKVSDLATQAGSAFNRQMISDATDYYVNLQNQVRMGVIISLCLLNMLAYGILFLGVNKKNWCLLELNYWFAAFTLWWIVVIAAVHFLLYVPVRDVCDRAVPYVSSPAVASLFDNLVTSGTGSTDLFPALANKLLQDPYTILHCPDNDTFLNRLDITITDYIPDLDQNLATFRETFLNATDSINANETVAEAQAAFDAGGNNVTNIEGNLDVYKNESQQISNQLSSIKSYLAETTANLTIEVDSTLIDLNGNTSLCCGLIYDLDNYTLVDTNLPPYDTATNKDAINATATELGFLVNAKNTTQQLEIDVGAASNRINASFALILDGVANMTNTLNTMTTNITAGSSIVSDLGSLQANFIDYALGVVTDAVTDVRQLLGLKNVGSCGFIGDFWQEGVEGNMCTDTKGGVGGAAVTLFLFALMMAASVPIVLQARFVVLDESINKKIKDENL